MESLPIPKIIAGLKTPPIKTQARSATVLPNFVGLIFQVHNGKNYINVEITEDMVGHKLGEFSPFVLRFELIAPLLISSIGQENRSATSRIDVVTGHQH
ncbi:37S ribosomal protein S19, mitochondrial [Golovinomyces cichoracearum]|uniref:37S ribosomal protein S19, mitochondrial n=1 Tax=Golovinomyces cichoracearum TaxID=62708 RepID=A0A420IP59_9PEZI|nr:37S ribosomal protein S19, mitochondrial [Golovinomyces cichoracearum]